MFSDTNKGKPLTYEQYVLHEIAECGISPGDQIRLVLRNEEQKGSMFEQANRHMGMFLNCYHFYPEKICIHSSHLVGIKAQGKTLDILFSEKISRLAGLVADLSTFPKRVPLVADDTLDPFTTVACYTLTMERATDIMEKLLLEFMQRHKK